MTRMAREGRKGSGEGLVRAAGGLLWREARGGPRLAVIHRPKHDDWSLPKGKLEPGESYPTAALREVAEETGCVPRLRQFAGYTLYQVKGRSKVVLFWHMTVATPRAFRPNREVDEIAWLTPGEALEWLDHPGERRIVQDAIVERAGRVANAGHRN